MGNDVMAEWKTRVADLQIVIDKNQAAFKRKEAGFWQESFYGEKARGRYVPEAVARTELTFLHHGTSDIILMHVKPEGIVIIEGPYRDGSKRIPRNVLPSQPTKDFTQEYWQVTLDDLARLYLP